MGSHLSITHGSSHSHILVSSMASKEGAAPRTHHSDRNQPKACLIVEDTRVSHGIALQPQTARIPAHRFLGQKLVLQQRTSPHPQHHLCRPLSLGRIRQAVLFQMVDTFQAVQGSHSRTQYSPIFPRDTTRPKIGGWEIQQSRDSGRGGQGQGSIYDVGVAETLGGTIISKHSSLATCFTPRQVKARFMGQDGSTFGEGLLVHAARSKLDPRAKLRWGSMRIHLCRRRAVGS